jgi:hypothetical protein
VSEATPSGGQVKQQARRAAGKEEAGGAARGAAGGREAHGAKGAGAPGHRHRDREQQVGEEVRKEQIDLDEGGTDVRNDRRP